MALPINTLPPPPTRQNPAGFAAAGDAFLGALPQLVTDMNEAITTVNGYVSTAMSAGLANAAANATTALNAASTATTKAGEALASANAAAASAASVDLSLKAPLASPVFSGNVGIGVTPSQPFHVYKLVSGGGTYAQIENPSTTAGSAAGLILFAGGGGGTCYGTASMSKEGVLTLANAFSGGAINLYASAISTQGNLSLSEFTEKTYAPAAGTAFTVSLANGSIQRFTTSGNITITLPASVAGKSFIVEILYGGAHTVTFAGGTAIKYPNGVAPTASSTAGKIDRYCIEQDGGATLISDAGRKF